MHFPPPRSRGVKPPYRGEEGLVDLFLAPAPGVARRHPHHYIAHGLFAQREYSLVEARIVAGPGDEGPEIAEHRQPCRAGTVATFPDADGEHGQDRPLAPSRPTVFRGNWPLHRRRQVDRKLSPRRTAPRECRSVAQPGSAPRSGRGGRRFKSCHSDQQINSLVTLAAPATWPADRFSKHPPHSSENPDRCAGRSARTRRRSVRSRRRARPAGRPAQAVICSRAAAREQADPARPPRYRRSVRRAAAHVPEAHAGAAVPGPAFDDDAARGHPHHARMAQPVVARHVLRFRRIAAVPFPMAPALSIAAPPSVVPIARGHAPGPIRSSRSWALAGTVGATTTTAVSMVAARQAQEKSLRISLSSCPPPSLWCAQGLASDPCQIRDESRVTARSKAPRICRNCDRRSSKIAD